MIAALFVRTNGSYYGIDGVDPWDEDRDARLYAGPFPVVAHPPCSRWCRLAGLIEHLYGYKVGDDNGCFENALVSVRKHGGVLEHPAYSLAWKHFDIPTPPSSGGWIRTICGGWTCQVEQGHYGHACRKPTWLYAFGTVPPSLIWGTSTGTKRISRLVNRGAGLPPASRSEAISTPPLFRDLLITIAREAKGGEG